MTAFLMIIIKLQRTPNIHKQKLNKLMNCTNIDLFKVGIKCLDQELRLIENDFSILGQ